MSKSKINKDRKENVKQFKEKLKQKIMKENQNAQIPPIRSIPIWKSHETIELSGLEFEAIFNYINNVQAAYGAIQSVLNNNILKDKIQLDFEKLNDTKTAYVPMSDEEKKPHQEEYAAMIAAAKELKNKPKEEIQLIEEPEQAKIIQL